MTIKEIFGYQNAKFAPVKEPAREVVKAYQDGNRFLDTTQEYVLIEHGMKNLARMIHNEAHELPKRFDAFADMLHERHLMAEYPATPELDWEVELRDIDDAFHMVIRVLENIQEALETFRKVTDNADLRPMALFAEELMSQNSKDYTKFLEAWALFDGNGNKSLTSFDNWVGQYMDGGNK